MYIVLYTQDRKCVPALVKKPIFIEWLGRGQLPEARSVHIKREEHSLYEMLVAKKEYIRLQKENPSEREISE